LKGIRGDITADHYHNFCIKRLVAAGVHLPDRSDKAFWETEIPDKFDRLLQNQPLRYDAIIVDEGQDFMAPCLFRSKFPRVPLQSFHLFRDQSFHYTGA